MNSLRVRLLVVIGASLLALWGAVAAWMLTELRSELRTTMDERLAASARMVAALASHFPASAVPDGAPAASLLDVVARDGLACEVSLLRGAISRRKVARTASSPALDDAAPGYGTHVFGGKVWRTYVLEQGDLRIATADRLDMREAMMRNVALTAAVPFAVALVGSLLAVGWGVARGLAPLERMRRVLADRRPDDDSALPQLRLPRELSPLVDTIGRLLDRVRGAITRERRFTDDAAHELRTPLTAVKTHLQVLRLSLTPAAGAAAAAALDDADEAVLRMQHSLEQLLTLARLEAPDAAEPAASSDARQVARQAIREVEASWRSPGRVTLSATDAEAALAVPESLLVSSLRNLLQNAFRASAPGAAIELEVAVTDAVTDTRRVAFRVLDRGVGMSQEECSQAVRRFWRRGKAGEGSGLGLSIVQAIAERYGGALKLAPRPGGGLCAELALPAAGPGRGADTA